MSKNEKKSGAISAGFRRAVVRGRTLLQRSCTRVDAAEERDEVALEVALEVAPRGSDRDDREAREETCAYDPRADGDPHGEAHGDARRIGRQTAPIKNLAKRTDDPCRADPPGRRESEIRDDRVGSPPRARGSAAVRGFGTRAARVAN